MARHAAAAGRAAREISYASSARTRGGRAVIRAVENATGRIGLIRRARGYDREVARGRDFWQVMAAHYGLSLDVFSGSLARIPATGPLVLVANHPWGILDGLMLGHVLARRRGDFRILANRVFRGAHELERIILPISFDETAEAVRGNVETRRRALDHLAGGGAVGVFPGGTVATARHPFGRPADPVWRPFTAKMVARSGAAVVPLYFDGRTSRLFQLASHLHPTLRVALLISEFRARVDQPVRIAVGEPIPPARLRQYAGDPRSMMDFLRQSTYALSAKPPGPVGYGYDFEDRYRV